MNEAYPDNSLREQVIDEGDVVYSLFWDSGAPGAGAEYECIYRYADKYYPVLSYDDSVVAYNTLEEALEATELTLLNEASQEIMSKEIPTDRLVQLLHYAGDQDVSIVINGGTWLATRGGEFRKI